MKKKKSERVLVEIVVNERVRENTYFVIQQKSIESRVKSPRE